MVRVSFHGATDIGLKRSKNEDVFAVEPDLGYCVVADGMGGAPAGEVASRIFAEAAYEVFSHKRPGLMPMDLVREAFLLANTKIISEVGRHPEFEGMGCTAELLSFHEEDYLLGHVGDSRTYISRNGQLRQITKDHSLVQDQLDKGLITPDEARTYSFKNVILKAVGVDEYLSVDLIKGRALDGDIFLLCSDGLTDMVDDEVIRDILNLQGDLRGKTEKLVQSAKLAGGKDNITLVLCQAALQ